MGAGSALSFGLGKANKSLAPLTWTDVSLGSGNNMENVFWLNDRFVAMGASGSSFNVFYSTNGINWTYASGAGASSMRAYTAAYGTGGNYVFGGYNYVTYTSSFSSYTNYTPFIVPDYILYFPNYSRFVMIQGGGSVYSSTNASSRTSWSFLSGSSPPSSMPYIKCGLVRSSGGTDTAILVGADSSSTSATGRIAYSTNGGSTWTVNSVTGTMYGCIWDGTKWVAVGSGYSSATGTFTSRIHTSTDGTTWTDITGTNTSIDSGFLSAIEYSPTQKRYVVGSKSSSDLISFVSDSNAFTGNNKMAYSPTLDRFVSVNGGSTIKYA